jgi:hypothetical protein
MVRDMTKGGDRNIGDMRAERAMARGRSVTYQAELVVDKVRAEVRAEILAALSDPGLRSDIAREARRLDQAEAARAHAAEVAEMRSRARPQVNAANVPDGTRAMFAADPAHDPEYVRLAVAGNWGAANARLQELQREKTAQEERGWTGGLHHTSSREVLWQTRDGREVRSDIAYENTSTGGVSGLPPNQGQVSVPYDASGELAYSSTAQDGEIPAFIKNRVRAFPDWTDEQVSAHTRIAIGTVRAVRQEVPAGD